MKVRVAWREKQGVDTFLHRKGIAFAYLWDTNLNDLGGAVALIQAGEKIISMPVDRLAFVDWVDE